MSTSRAQNNFAKTDTQWASADWRWPFIVALALRLAYVLFYPQQVIRNDAACYDWLGWSLAQGLGYQLPDGPPDVYWSPGFPALLAGIYAVFGHSIVIVRVLQAALSATLPIVVFYLAVRPFGRRSAVIAAWLVALYPAYIAYSGLLLTETVFTSLVALTMLWLMRVNASTSTLRLAGIGVVIGVTCLCRAETMLLPLFMFLVLRVLMRNATIGVKQIVIVYAAMFLTIAPWTIRNYRVTGEFIPLTVHDGDVLWISSYKEELLELDTEREPYKSLVAGLSQVEASKALRNAGIQNIKDSPATFLRLSLNRVPRLWIGGHSNVFRGMEDSIGAYRAQGRYGIWALKNAMVIGNCLLILLGLYGACRVFVQRRDIRREWWILASPVVFITAVHFVLFSTSRFHVPVMPYVLIFAAVVIASFSTARSANRV